MQQTASLYDFTIKWEPFLLRPNMPEEGMEKPADYTVSKTGRLYQSGQSVDIDFTGKCPRFPYTVPSHAMLEYAAGLDKTGKVQNDVQEHLFQAYFTDGVYPDMSLFNEIAKKMNFNQEEFSSYMNNPVNLDKAKEKAMSWRHRVQTGVPFFVINGHDAFSGAQETDTFVKTFDIIAKKHPSLL